MINMHQLISSEHFKAWNCHYKLQYEINFVLINTNYLDFLIGVTSYCSYSELHIKFGKWNFPAAYDKHVWRSRVLDQCAMCIRVWEHELERRTHVSLLINEILVLLRCEMRATSSTEYISSFCKDYTIVNSRCHYSIEM